ncbi:hypothetical protein N431DRAFT_219679 [Stipitochalara longipes BDJ]|nr:hypothetical protein N431DRAFT_219679 [Stipitochalara longipes BDJ]
MASRLPRWPTPTPGRPPGPCSTTKFLGELGGPSRPSRPAMAGIILAHAGPGTLAAATTGLQPPKHPSLLFPKDPPFFVNPGLYDLFGAGTVRASVGTARTWLIEDDPKSLGVPVQDRMLAGEQLLRKAKSVISSKQPSAIHRQHRSVWLPHQPVKGIRPPRVLLLLNLFVFFIQSRVLTALEAHDWSILLNRSPLPVRSPPILQKQLLPLVIPIARTATDIQ